MSRVFVCPDDPAIGEVDESDLVECDACDGTGLSIQPLVPCPVCLGLGKVVGYRPNGPHAVGCQTLRARPVNGRRP